ncbi:MAG: GDP-mannose 4,6-dehydratase [Candidatus Manganitrophus sp.]|nr:MAG: GDP-mannose 4,6-dehydratase [Candidatus Manganitrophus sp.]
MLQQETPQDYVIATGESYSVRQFVEYAFEVVGIHIEWRGAGVEEKGIDAATGKVLVEIDPRYYRPAEVDLLCGDPSKAKCELGWQAKVSIRELVKLMVNYDLKYEDYGGKEA